MRNASTPCTTAVWQRPAGYSRVGVPPGTQGTVLAFLQARFPRIAAARWLARLAAGEVLDGRGHPLQADSAIEGLAHLHYRRMPEAEPVIPFTAQVLHHDAHLVVADKPHFLPTAPAGQYAEQTLLTQLQRRLDLPQLSPLHRLDKDTAGLVLLSCNPASRDAYHRLFREQQVHKEYQAVARWDARFAAPYRHASRMEPGGPRFFTMHEVDGPPNSATTLQILARSGHWALYRLQPVSGKKHQLRVHMAALKVPIRHDPFYPDINDPPPDDFSRPLQLLARRLRFVDPLTGQLRILQSQLQLLWPPAPQAD